MYGSESGPKSLCVSRRKWDREAKKRPAGSTLVAFLFRETAPKKSAFPFFVHFFSSSQSEGYFTLIHLA